MAFRNQYGEAISYDCEELIYQLEKDITKFGANAILLVITEERNGVTIYKNYQLMKESAETLFILSEKEKMQRITASALLMLYEKQNDIF